MTIPITSTGGALDATLFRARSQTDQSVSATVTTTATYRLCLHLKLGN